MKARAIKLLTGDERVDREMFHAFKGTPWCLDPSKQTEAQAGLPVIPPRIVAEPMVARDALPPQATAAERGDADDPERRQVKIRRNVELQKYGYTPGCEGCAQAELGLEHRGHSATPDA